MSYFDTSESANLSSGGGFGQPPRKLVNRPGQSLSPGCTGLLIMPHTLVGIFMICWLVHQLLVMLVGINLPANIVNERYSVSHKSSSITYHVQVEYNFQDKVYRSWIQCDEEMYDAASIQNHLRIGAERAVSTTTVRIFPLTPTWDVEMIPDNGQAMKQLTFSIVFALFWNLIVGAFWYPTFIQPVTQKRVVRMGSYVTGSVIGTRLARSRTTMYLLEYAYEPTGFGTGSGQRLSGKMNVLGAAYNHFKEGDPVTVFYDPMKPKNSYAYEPGRYEIVG